MDGEPWKSASLSQKNTWKTNPGRLDAGSAGKSVRIAKRVEKGTDLTGCQEGRKQKQKKISETRNAEKCVKMQDLSRRADQMMR